MTKQLIFFSSYWWSTIEENIKYYAEHECKECMLETDTKQEYMNQKEKLVNTVWEESPLDWKSPYTDYLVIGKIFHDKPTQDKRQ